MGGSTFAVSLPKHWVETVGLAVGGELVLHPRADGSLLLIPRRDAPVPTRIQNVDVSSNDHEEILRSIIALYVAGNDVIILHAGANSSPDAIRVAAQEACRRLLGLQVVDESTGSLTLQDLADPQDLEVRKAVRMMQLHAHRMLNASRRLIERPDDATAQIELDGSETELDRLHLLLVKQHNRFLTDLNFGERAGIPPGEALGYLLVALYLERIGDYAQRVAQAAPDLVRLRDTAGLNHILAAADIARKCVEDAGSAFQKKDAALANATIRLAASLGHLARTAPEDFARSLRRPGGPPTCELCFGLNDTFEFLERIGLYAKSIAEVALNHAYATPPKDKP
ncbi:MAG: PhoU domain-containing protein [Candidatus Thermoplasmatota archaeon]